MGRPDYARCRICGRNRKEAGEMSHTRQCRDCGRARLAENIDGIHTHSGPAFTRWRRAMAASVGAILLDDVDEPT